jgi:hypothetical protein
MKVAQVCASIPWTRHLLSAQPANAAGFMLATLLLFVLAIC